MFIVSVLSIKMLLFEAFGKFWLNKVIFMFLYSSISPIYVKLQILQCFNGDLNVLVHITTFKLKDHVILFLLPS